MLKLFTAKTGTQFSVPQPNYCVETSVHRVKVSVVLEYWVFCVCFCFLTKNLHGSGTSHATTASLKHHSGHLGGCSLVLSIQRKCWMDIIKEWTFQPMPEWTSRPMPELLKRPSCRKDWKRISTESSFMSPHTPPPTTHSIKGLN